MAVSNTSEPDISADTQPGLLSVDSYWLVINAILCVDTLIGLFASGANIMTIAVYRKQGYADSTNISLTALAVSDLGVAITTIGSVPGVFLPTLPNMPFTMDIFIVFSATTHLDFVRLSALITTYISVERYLCVSFPLKIKSITTPRRTLIAVVMSFTAIFGVSPGNPQKSNALEILSWAQQKSIDHDPVY